MAGVGQGAGDLETRLEEAIRAALASSDLGYVRYSDVFSSWFALLLELNLIKFFHTVSLSCRKTCG